MQGASSLLLADTPGLRNFSRLPVLPRRWRLEDEEDNDDLVLPQEEEAELPRLPVLKRGREEPEEDDPRQDPTRRPALAPARRPGAPLPPPPQVMPFPFIPEIGAPVGGDPLKRGRDEPDDDYDPRQDPTQRPALIPARGQAPVPPPPVATPFPFIPPPITAAEENGQVVLDTTAMIYDRVFGYYDVLAKKESSERRLYARHAAAKQPKGTGARGLSGDKKVEKLRHLLEHGFTDDRNRPIVRSKEQRELHETYIRVSWA